IELASIGRDKRRASAPSLPGDEYVVRPDRLPGAFQFGAHGAGLTSVVLIEGNPLQRPREKCGEPPGVALPALTLRDTVPELEGHNRGHQQSRPPGDGASKAATDFLRRPIDQR